MWQLLLLLLLLKTSVSLLVTTYSRSAIQHTVKYDAYYPMLHRLSTVDAHTDVLKPVHGNIIRHYSLYCVVAFCYEHKCELSYIHPGHDVKLHPPIE